VRLSPFLRDVALTVITSIVAICSSIVATRWIAQGLGPEEFGVYSVGRRAAMLITTLASLDIGVTLARYLGLSRGSRSATRSYLIVSIFTVACTTVLVAAVGAVFAGQLSVLVFGSNAHRTVVYAMLCLVAGHSAFTLLYSYLRGTGKMRLSNLLHLLVMSVGSLGIAYAYSDSASSAVLFYYVGFLYFSSAPILLSIGARAIKDGDARKDLSRSFPEIIKYCLPRVAGAFAFQGLYSIGPIVASHYCSMSEVGYLAFGQLLVLMMIDVVAGSFGLVALPKAAQMIAENRQDLLREKTRDLVAMALHLGLFVSIQLWIWTEEIILVWLGAEYAPAADLARIFAASFVFYLCYALLKPIIDALEVRAINTFNLLVSLAVATVCGVGLAQGGLGIVGVALGVSFGIFALGYLTARYLSKRQAFFFSEFKPGLVALVNLGFLGIGYLVHVVVRRTVDTTSAFLLGILVEILMMLAYIFCLKRAGVTWIRNTVSMVFKT
jgi:O-antigen/teichoic acid export membrane protein